MPALLEPQRERVAVIAGATGLVGRACLDFLLESPRYEAVYAVGRRKPPREHHRLTAIETEFSKLGEVGLGQVNDVFCCLGTTIKKAGSRAGFRAVDYDLPMQLAHATRDHGADHLALVSSIGADPNARSFYLRVKGETERAIAAVGIRSLAFFRPSLLLGDREERRVGESLGKAVASTMRPLMLGPLARYRAIEARDVALAMVLVAASTPFGTHVIESDTIGKMVRSSTPLCPRPGCIF